MADKKFGMKATSYLEFPARASFVEKNSQVGETRRQRFESCKRRRKEEMGGSGRVSPEAGRKEFNRTEMCGVFAKAPKLDVRIIEEWINSSLRDVQSTVLPNQLLKDSSKTPLGNFCVDRENLLVSRTLIIEILIVK